MDQGGLTSLIDFAAIPAVYFMMGLNPAADVFFFFAFITLLFALVLLSASQASANTFVSMEVAQAVLGLLIPLMFLASGPLAYAVGV